MNKYKDENREEAAKKLRAKGFFWTSYNNDMQWKIGTVDIYPTTHKWIDTKDGQLRQGLAELIEHLRKPKKQPEAQVIGQAIHPGKILSVDQIFDVAKKGPYTSLYDRCAAIHKAIYGG